MTRWISLIGTGGTIASVDDGAGRLTPHLDSAELVPSGLGHLGASVVARSFTSLPSREMGPSRMFELARRVREEIEAGASGVVVTHGTDTLEETAYALRMLLPCAVLSRDRVWLLADPDPFPHTLTLVQAPDRRVALLWAVGDDDSFVIDHIATALDGLVVAALGAGHVSARQALALKRLSGRCSVVLASRCGAGPVLTNTYGGAGSESDLTSAGLVPAGRLDPVKCRLRLLFGLSSGVRVADLFPVG